MPHSAATPPMTPGTCATLACIWEATAAKPGNVYRGADFEDLTYVDFLVSAAVIGPVLEKTAEQGVGATLLEAIEQTQAAVATNTNLGILLLLVPLSSVPAEQALADGMSKVLASLTAADAKLVFEAIRLAQPGGLGRMAEADVNRTDIPELSLVAAMQLAADRDLIAKQYTNQFQQVFQIADQLEQGVRQGWPLGDTVVRVFLGQLASCPDSLIARKCGQQVAEEVSAQAAFVISQGKTTQAAYETALQEFDFSLRIDGHRRNPGTTADLIAAGLFVLLREERLKWPVRFYREA